MQGVVKINLNGVAIYLMEVSDSQYIKYCNALNQLEMDRLEKITRAEKKVEFAASRYLKHQLFGNLHINYHESGTPFLENEGNIALSHTKKLVGIGQCNIHSIGIDIEPISGKAKKVATKFCSEAESHFFNIEDEKEMTLLWSFKETLYKLSDRKQLIFKTDIRVYQKDTIFYGEVRSKDGFFKTVLDYTEFNGNYITCNHTSLELLDENY
jgi:4'-phosphopantetheinyl transferase EntD